MDDHALWEAFTRGDRSALEFMYQKNIRILIAYGFRISNDRDLVQDSIQDLFIELWDGRERLSAVASIKSYLLKSLRYKIVRSVRYAKTEALGDADYQVEYDHFESRMLEEETKVQNNQRLHAAIERLPKRQREAIHLRYFQELSNDEVAALMGVNYQSACKFIYTALKNLRDVMLLIWAVSC
ncbi:sigma-70 family RNA polymerase sigma factor [Ravibacter arvi]|uniref:Sigma-70 family RNA polymerase sigma factor n=1 Tax=Ravibacter arvi TaxID=2051041 RepID=A0ABP8LY59_9BACT